MKRRRFTKSKADYVAECAKYRDEIKELQSRLKTDHVNRINGRLDAFKYVITAIELSSSLDDLMTKVRQVVEETERDLEL